jgi:hypothetical protein
MCPSTFHLVVADVSHSSFGTSCSENNCLLADMIANNCLLADMIGIQKTWHVVSKCQPMYCLSEKH